MTTKEFIEDALICRIAAGELRNVLPSLKKLKVHYGVAIGTLIKAIESLKEIGLCTSKQGGGFYLEEGAAGIARHEIRKRIEESGKRILEMAKAANVAVAINYTERG